jgi:hypothetical protein
MRKRLAWDLQRSEEQSETLRALKDIYDRKLKALQIEADSERSMDSRTGGEEEEIKIIYEE